MAPGLLRAHLVISSLLPSGPLGEDWAEEPQPAGCQAQPSSPLLAAVSHWSPSDELQSAIRTDALKRTLRTLAGLPGVRAEAVVLTNVWVPGLDGLAARQVVQPRPRCGREVEHHLCMPWEAIRALRSLSAGGAPAGCDLDERALCGELQHDYYIYLEDDIEIPATSFSFWVEHGMDLYKMGYLLLPHRREGSLEGVLTDCFDVDCLRRTHAVKDASSPAERYGGEPHERVYLRPDNPYTACFWMTSEQFQDYLNGLEWDYLRKDRQRPAYLLGGRRQVWGVREQAAGGLLWDPRFGPRRALTHLSMPVVHQLPVRAEGPVAHREVADYERKVAKCAKSWKSCKALAATPRDKAPPQPRPLPG